MLKFELGKSYLCVKVIDKYPWFTVGKVYETIEGIDEPYILSDTGMKWYSSDRDLLQKDGSATFTEFSSDESVKSYTKMKLKKGDLVSGKAFGSNTYFTGIITDIDEDSEYAKYMINTDYGKIWLQTDTVESRYTCLESQPLDQGVEIMFTKEEVNKVIAKAHQYFNNDSQRLAYIRGYFAK